MERRATAWATGDNNEKRSIVAIGLYARSASPLVDYNRNIFTALRRFLNKGSNDSGIIKGAGSQMPVFCWTLRLCGNLSPMAPPGLNPGLFSSSCIGGWVEGCVAFVAVPVLLATL